MNFKLTLRQDRPATIEERRELLNRILLLESVIASTIESIKFSSCGSVISESAVECLQAAIDHRSGEVDVNALQTLAVAISKFAPDLTEELIRRWKAKVEAEGS